MSRLITLTTLLLYLSVVHGDNGVNESTRRLEERVEALEMQGTELLKRLDKQEEQLQSQSLVIKKQEKLLLKQIHEREKLKILVRTLNHTVQDQGQAITRLKLSNRLLRKPKVLHQPQNTDVSPHNTQYYPNSGIQSARTSKIKSTGHSLAKELVDTRQRNVWQTKRLVLADEGPVAFHAVIDGSEVPHLGINQNIIFKTVVENLGGAYHNQHGVFIAPRNGVYIFSVSITSYVSPHPEVQAHLEKDGAILANVFAHGDSGRHDQGSVTVVTKLNQGNEVWVSLRGPNDDSLYGGRFSTFTGCLINAV